MADIFIVLELLGICIIFVAMGLMITDDGTKEQKIMSYFLCGSLIQNVGYLLELTAPTLDAAVVAVKIEYLGSIFVPLCYCLFIYVYCYEDVPQRVVKMLAVIDMCLLISVFCFDRHDFYYQSYQWVERADGHYYISLQYGPGFPLFLIFGCIVPYVMSGYALFKAVFTKSEYSTNRKYKSIIILQVLPLAALLLYVGKFTAGYDPTPFVMGVVLSLVVILIWRSRTSDLKSMAAEVVLSSMGDGVIVLDNRKRILNYNQPAVEIFKELGYHRAGDSIEDIKNIPNDIFMEDDNKEFSLNDRFYESHTKYIVDKNGKKQGCVILILDVTDTKNYIEEIKSVREQAEKANMAKSEFLANMSHEIRTPMNAVMGLSDIIMEESKGRRIYSYACDIKSASQNLLAIINDILDLSKVEAGKMELVTSDYYVKSVVNEVVHMMDIAASKRGLLMKYEFDETIPCRYNGDEGRIKQILINILNNAVKFTKEGYIRVSVEGCPGASSDEELLIFKIKDTGCGIKKEDQEKIFENFKQVNSSLNRSAEGTGLGLSITKRLVELMNGKIELESVYGEGTTFTVTIPQRIVDTRAIAEVTEESDTEAENVEYFVAKGYRVLVVDDNLINRKVAKGFLDPYGFELDEASSGFEAIDLVRKNKYDIIFMDHMMPELDGIETVQIMHRECGENGRTPVIIALTANAMDGVKDKFLRSGFHDFVGKPLDRKQLNEVLNKWVPDEYKEKPKSYGSNENVFQEQRKRKSELAGLVIKGIDMETAMKYQTGTKDDYKELLQLYCMDGKRKLELIRKLYEEKNYKAYETEVHGLKSASANIGAMKLSLEAKAHEMAAEGGDYEYIESHFSELMAIYQEQINNIYEFLEQDGANQGGLNEDGAGRHSAEKNSTEKNGAEADSTEQNKAGNADTEPENIDIHVIIEEAKTALERLESFRSKECLGRVEGLLRHRLDNETAAELKEIREQLKLYEDDKAEQLLHQLLERLNKEE